MSRSKAVIGVCLALVLAPPWAHGATAFTYQGQLAVGGSSANGDYDLRFILYDQSVGGSQVSVTVIHEAVPVADGRFAIGLDFGAGAFPGAPRWLEVAARPAGSGDYTTLSPRQEVTPTPYALFSNGAPWAGLAGVPAGFADGVDDDTLASLACAPNQVTKWSGSAWACAADDNTTYSAGVGLALTGTQFRANFAGSGVANTVARSDHDHGNEYARYARTVVVGPVGTPADNGAALTAAIAALTGASATNRYLLKLEPGIYELAGGISLKSFVDIEGSGEKSTIIRGLSYATSTISSVAGLLRMPSEADLELRFLTIHNTGQHAEIGNRYSAALWIGTHSTTAASLLQVTALTDVIGPDATQHNHGITSSNAASRLRGVTAMARNGSTRNAGLGVLTTSSSVSQYRVEVRDSVLVGEGGTNSYGAFLFSNGVWTPGSDEERQLTHFRHSTLRGGTRSISSATNGIYVINVANCQLAGPVVGHAAAKRCAGWYGEDFVLETGSCP